MNPEMSNDPTVLAVMAFLAVVALVVVTVRGWHRG